jgi:HSP20 family protein
MSAMAANTNRDTHTEQRTTRRTSTNSTGGTGNTRGTNTAGNAAAQSDRAENRSEGSITSHADRERPIASGRERDQQRARAGIVRNQGGGLGATALANSPFTLMQRMAEDMDRLFEQFGFGRTGLGLMPQFRSFGSTFDDDLGSNRSASGLNTVWTPQVETFRRGDQLVIRADIPGVKKDDVHVEIENDLLTISGERREEHEEDREGYYRSERSYGQFYRAIPLPEGVTGDRCEASFKDGVLEVTLPAPRQEERKARRIQVK